jgi:isoquinoline 1-oxidoreductase
MLLDLAAEQWKADRSALSIAGGKVTSGSRSAGFGELTRGQKLTRTISTAAAVTPTFEWKVMGAPVPKLDGRAFVTGKHRYATDLKLPGMLYGKVLRPPAYGATLVSVDIRAAQALPGVKVVRDGEFTGVAAPDSDLAEKGLAALRAEWKTIPQPSSRDLFRDLRNTAAASNLPQPQAIYTVAYIAHVPLEPRAAVAEWKDGKLTVWTGTQRPFGVRSELASAFNLGEDRVRVIMPDTGSGYGGKHTGEAALDAARLAKAAGAPVKVVWTREEEFTWAYLRPAGVIEISAAAAEDGAITSWEFHNFNSGSSAIRSPYHVPGQRSEYHQSKSPLRQGSYRGLAATANHFARECYMDELAHSLKMDPLEFRLKNARDERLRAVIDAAAGRFGWKARKKGSGIAAGFEKGGYVATCAEVRVEPSGQVRVVRLVTAFECGAVVNPDHLRNQIEGGVLMGIGGALFEQVGFENGKLLNGRLSRYRVPRFTDLPVIETVLVNRKDLPSAGAGETPIVGVAPAIGNAIFDATGKRIRSMPLAPHGITG